MTFSEESPLLTPPSIPRSMPWKWDTAASESIFILLNTQDAEKRDELTKRWRDSKLAELNFIGIVVRLPILIPSPAIPTKVARENLY